jgi:hypothetical protein
MLYGTWVLCAGLLPAHTARCSLRHVPNANDARGLCLGRPCIEQQAPEAELPTLCIEDYIDVATLPGRPQT